MDGCVDAKQIGDVQTQLSGLNKGLEALDHAITRVGGLTEPIRKAGPETATGQPDPPVQSIVPLACDVFGYVMSLEHLRLRLVGIADEISI